jgi:hypothetical protein
MDIHYCEFNFPYQEMLPSSEMSSSVPDPQSTSEAMLLAGIVDPNLVLPPRLNLQRRTWVHPSIVNYSLQK